MKRSMFKKIIIPIFIALFLGLIGVFIIVQMGMKDKTYSDKELKKLRDEIKEERLENDIWREGIIGVKIDYEGKVIIVEISSLSKNKGQIIDELTKKYGRAVWVTIVEVHQTVT
ncbi:MAG: hypothetical protein E7261_04575 [Lachnospiraceae bacterium]|nr:hypothetical protein [Lachnospiraceae bacterium]